MKFKSNILASRAATLLGGAMLLAMLPATAAMAADQMPVKAKAVAAETGWYYYGDLEAGYNFFIQKPGSGFGRTATDPFWLTPNTSDSNAKMDEYGKVPRGLYLDTLGIHAGKKDGSFAVDFWADNVGYDNQRYQLNVYEPGKQYFNFGWDQTPHLLSSSAKSIFGGVGSTNLTVDPTSRTFLQANSNVAAQSQAQRNCIEAYIDGLPNPGGCSGAFPGAAPITNIELKTLREKFSAGYRNTMWDNWDFNFSYSNEHRTGTRPLGIGFGQSTTSASPRPSTGAVEVPQPLDDRTQIGNASGEYVGTTPWGTRFNTSLAYMGSYFTNNNKVLDVQNPFCITCNGSGIGVGPFGPNTLRYGLYADNNVNGLTWNLAADIPIFKTKYTSNIQYMMFRQNDPFIDTATNGIATTASLTPSTTALNPYPRSSLNGEVNAFLTNNVFYSHLSHDVTNTARIRYYDRQDNTPPITFLNYHFADTGFATTAPLTRSSTSYTKLNLEDQVKWDINRTWAIGGGPFMERLSFAEGEVDSTKEFGGKAFLNMTMRLATWRSSVEYSQRRYGSWLATSTDPAAAAMRHFFVANRDRTKMNTVIELAAFKNVTISPNGGMRYDNYPGDQVLSGNTVSALVPPLTDSVGTKYDRSWNAGVDVSWRATQGLRLALGYNHEEHYLRLQSCCGGAAGTVPFNDRDKWASDIRQFYNTYVASADWKAIPGKLEFKADYVAALSNEANQTVGCSANNNSCTGNNSTGPTSPWPDEKNLFQRFNFTAKYYVDPVYVKQMHWFGEVTIKARYTWEQNRNSNWATDNFSPYSPSAADAGGTDITNGGKSLFLAYNNPNYTAQIVSIGIGTKW